MIDLPTNTKFRRAESETQLRKWGFELPEIERDEYTVYRLWDHPDGRRICLYHDGGWMLVNGGIYGRGTASLIDHLRS